MACVDRFLAHLKPGSKCTLREEAYFISHEGWKLYTGLDKAWDFIELPTNEETLRPEEKPRCLHAKIGETLNAIIVSPKLKATQDWYGDHGVKLRINIEKVCNIQRTRVLFRDLMSQWVAATAVPVIDCVEIALFMASEKNITFSDNAWCERISKVDWEWYERKLGQPGLTQNLQGKKLRPGETWATFVEDKEEEEEHYIAEDEDSEPPPQYPPPDYQEAPIRAGELPPKYEHAASGLTISQYPSGLYEHSKVAIQFRTNTQPHQYVPQCVPNCLGHRKLL